MRAMVPDSDAAEVMGGVPSGVELLRWDGRSALPDGAAEVEFYVPSFLAKDDEPLAAMSRLPRLRVVQLLTAGAEVVLPHVPPGVTLCTARGAHDASTAEWVVGALLASLRELPRFTRAQDAGRWDYGPTDALAGKTVLFVGAGSICGALERRLAGFEVSVLRAARRAREGVVAMADVPDLLPQADVVVLLVPLTRATRGLVDAKFLAHLRDGALLVNAARGPVVDTDALLAELTSGRLRAALDVTDPEPLPAGHPLWSAPGLLLTPHVGGSTPLGKPRAYAIVKAQLERFQRGEPLVNVVSEEY